MNEQESGKSIREKSQFSRNSGGKSGGVRVIKIGPRTVRLESDSKVDHSFVPPPSVYSPSKDNSHSSDESRREELDQLKKELQELESEMEQAGIRLEGNRIQNLKELLQREQELRGKIYTQMEQLREYCRREKHSKAADEGPFTKYFS